MKKVIIIITFCFLSLQARAADITATLVCPEEAPPPATVFYVNSTIGLTYPEMDFCFFGKLAGYTLTNEGTQFAVEAFHGMNGEKSEITGIKFHHYGGQNEITGIRILTSDGSTRDYTLTSAPKEQTIEAYPTIEHSEPRPQVDGESDTE